MSRFINVNETTKDAIPSESNGKFETCKGRAEKPSKEKDCCGKYIFGFRCNFRNIFPITPAAHCMGCKKYVPK